MNARLRTPCCDRAVTPCRLMQYATEVVERTCPRCRVLYAVVVKPLHRGAGVYLHEVNWAVREVPQEKSEK